MNYTIFTLIFIITALISSAEQRPNFVILAQAKVFNADLKKNVRKAGFVEQPKALSK